MKISTHSTPAARHDGGQPDDTNGETSPAVVYDTCAACPVYAYRDAVCNGNLRALVRSGNPSDAELAEARDALAAEFADLSGNLNLQAANAATARSMALRYRLLALSAALLAADHPNAAALFARSGWGKLPLEQQIKRAEARIKELTVRLNKENQTGRKTQTNRNQTLHGGRLQHADGHREQMGRIPPLRPHDAGRTGRLLQSLHRTD